MESQSQFILKIERELAGWKTYPILLIIPRRKNFKDEGWRQRKDGEALFLTMESEHSIMKSYLMDEYSKSSGLKTETAM